MTMLTKIGNSQGIRIPKPLIQQAHLENGLLIKPITATVRESWKESIESTLSKYKDTQDEGLLEDLLNDNDLEEYEW